MAACIRADLKLCKLLLGHGAAVGFEDRRGNAALSYASYRGNTKLLRTLIEDEGASVDVRSFDGRTPLFNAVEYNSPKVRRTNHGSFMLCDVIYVTFSSLFVTCLTAACT